MSVPAPAIRDGMLRFLVRERRKFRIDNSIIAADDISLTLTAGLSKPLGDSGTKLVRIALREMIINAIEHGNLNISFAEKSAALANDEYFSLIRKRQKDPRYSDKKIDIEYSLDHDRAIYRITDRGNGFDHEKILAGSEDSINDSFLAHGRGISMARRIFHHLKFNDQGNEVTLVKFFGDHSR
jgi:anti-sigma regulatory factor (Ser/Thr protein kinase)